MRMTLIKPFLALTLLLSLTVQACTEYPETAAPVVSDDYQATLIAEGLMIPWTISWLPDGDMLVTEREGKLRIIRDGRLLPSPVTGLPDIYTQGGGANFRQAGLFEVEPHPDFATNNLLYFTYSSGEEGRNTLALARGRWVNGDTPRLEDV
ncbi:MAG: PQQ-dependent sugar dehydrogenase, partial [Pseudomonadota bacterium]